MENYQKQWQEQYGKYPYTEYGGDDIGPEEYSDEMVNLFENAGVLKLTKERPIKILSSSVSTGKRIGYF